MVDLKNSPVNGTLIWYYYICKRQVWFISHGIEPSQENEHILMGRLIHEEFYRHQRKELLIDGKIKIDLIRGRKLVGEIKKSSRYLKSAKMQLAFYLLYLKEVKGLKLKGVLLVPEERKNIEVELTEELERELERAIKEIEKVVKSEKVPELKKTPYCSKCAYRELCWS